MATQEARCWLCGALAVTHDVAALAPTDRGNNLLRCEKHKGIEELEDDWATALAAVSDALDNGISDVTEFTISNAYVALDMARCILEALPAGDNPVTVGLEAVRRWRHEASPWSAARA